MKTIISSFLIAASLSLFGQTATADLGVVINGVRWATCNVGEPGKFVAKPEDAGGVFQWNRRTAWKSMPKDGNVGTIPVDFLSAYPGGNAWERANDPSPEGWRVPTSEELKKLLDTNRVSNTWITQNGIAGRRFTDLATGASIFIPAVGRWWADINAQRPEIKMTDVGKGGYYWCSNPRTVDILTAWTLDFTAGKAEIHFQHRTFCYMIRPVAIK